MKTSETIIKIAPALLEAQKKIGAAKKGSVNPFFHSTYASLGDVMEACKDILNENNILVLQPVVGMSVETVLLHNTGEWISSETPIVCKEDNNPQSLGSAISYARRYGLQSMVFIPAEDDDAEKATARTTTTPKVTPTVQVNTDNMTCKKHNVQMKLNRNGKPYHIANDEFCNGRGFPSEIDGEDLTEIAKKLNKEPEDALSDYELG